MDVFLPIQNGDFFHVSFAGKNTMDLPQRCTNLDLEPPIPTGPRKFALALGSKNPRVQTRGFLDTWTPRWAPKNPSYKWSCFNSLLEVG